MRAIKFALTKIGYDLKGTSLRIVVCATLGGSGAGAFLSGLEEWQTAKPHQ